ncbi:MAG: hypothetical protein GY937_20040 [bacterium]|nr:hypothetical protein [bacterium]
MRLIEIEAFDLQVVPVWEAEIRVRDHKPLWSFTGDFEDKMYQVGYLATGPLISAIGHWVVVFETLDGTGEPAVLYLGNIQLCPLQADELPQGPFEVPRRRNYKLPPGWHWAKFDEVWLKRRGGAGYMRELFMKVRERRI